MRLVSRDLVVATDGDVHVTRAGHVDAGRRVADAVDGAQRSGRAAGHVVFTQRSGAAGEDVELAWRHPFDVDRVGDADGTELHRRRLDVDAEAVWVGAVPAAVAGEVAAVGGPPNRQDGKVLASRRIGMGDWGEARGPKVNPATAFEV